MKQKVCLNCDQKLGQYHRSKFCSFCFETLEFYEEDKSKGIQLPIPTKENISWERLSPNGLLSQKFKEGDQRFQIIPAFGNYLPLLTIYALFFAYMIFDMTFRPLIFLDLVVLTIFIFLVMNNIVRFTKHMLKRLTFDNNQGVYFWGKDKAKRKGSIYNFTALQLIKEEFKYSYFRVSGKMKMKDFGYELNLVFENGERLNIMDLGDCEEVELAAKQLSIFLDIPIWKESEKSNEALQNQSEGLVEKNQSTDSKLQQKLWKIINREY